MAKRKKTPKKKTSVRRKKSTGQYPSGWRKKTGPKIRIRRKQKSQKFAVVTTLLLAVLLSFAFVKTYRAALTHFHTSQQKPVRKSVASPEAKPAARLKAKPAVVDAKPTKPAPSVQPEPAKASVVRMTSRWLNPAKPWIAFVIDDMGHERNYEGTLKELTDRVTYAILPHLPHSSYFGKLSTHTGADVILHLPLDAISNTIPGPGLIVETMSAEDVRRVLHYDLLDIPNHIGVNNHMGSRGTANPRLMEIIMEDLKRRDLFFLDSFTTAKSVALPTAQRFDIPSLRRDIFLDNIDRKPEILSQIEKTAAVAREKGYAVAIGHYRKNTLEVLAEEIKKLEASGFEVVPLSAVIKRFGE